jgi:hypothetical protein
VDISRCIRVYIRVPVISRLLVSKKSRTKGARFEKETCEILSKWWYGQDGILRRTPGSGAWEKGMGDVTLPPSATDHGLESFPFYVECRNREGWKLEELFDTEGEVHKWWIETFTRASVFGKVPLLIFTRNHVPAFVAFVPDNMSKLVPPKGGDGAILVFHANATIDFNGGTTEIWGTVMEIEDFVKTYGR